MRQLWLCAELTASLGKAASSTSASHSLPRGSDARSFFPGSASLSSPPIPSGDPHLDQTNKQTNKPKNNPSQNHLPRIKVPCTSIHAKGCVQRCPRPASWESHGKQFIFHHESEKKKKNTGGPDQHCTPDSLQDPNSKASRASAATTCQSHCYSSSLLPAGSKKKKKKSGLLNGTGLPKILPEEKKPS